MADVRYATPYYPRLTLYRKPLPDYPAFLYDVFSDAMREHSAVEPGRRTNLVWNLISGEQYQETEGLPGQPRKQRPAAITLDYSVEWAATQATDWVYTPSDEENRWRALGLKQFNKVDAAFNAQGSDGQPRKPEKQPLENIKKEVDRLQKLPHPTEVDRWLLPIAQRIQAALEKDAATYVAEMDNVRAVLPELRNLAATNTKVDPLTASDTQMEALALSLERAAALEKLIDVTGTFGKDLRTYDTTLDVLAQLSQGGAGYARTAWQFMNSGVSGLFWSLMAPNVPVTLYSAFRLLAHHPFSIRLKRLKAPEGQGRHRFVIGFGNGFTWYEIIIGEDGNSAEFVHYRNMAAATRQQKQAQLDAILDKGRITVADRIALLDYEEAEQRIRVAAKSRGKNERQLTPEESAQITTLRANAKTLKENKKLSNQDEEDRRKLENELYIARENFKLQERANDLIGKEVDITVQFLRSGYVMVSVEDSRYIYENKRITGMRPSQYATLLPENSYLMLKSDGGKFGVVYGYPRYRGSGTFWSQLFDIPAGAGTGSARFDVEGWIPDGCGIGPQMVTTDSGRQQVQIELTSDTYQTPELYRCEAHIPAAAVPAYGPVVWSSQTQGADPHANSGNTIKDVTVQESEGRSLSTTVVMGRKTGTDLPLNVSGLVADVTLYDRAANATRIVQKQGMVSEVPQPRVERLETGSGMTLHQGAGAEARLNIVGVENFLDAEIRAAIVGNNMYPNDYLRALCWDAGLHPSLYSGIPSADVGIPRIEKTKPGTLPDCKPALGAHYWEWIQEVAKKHCPGWALGSGSDGLYLVQHGMRDRPDLTYNVPPYVPSTSKLCIRQGADGKVAPTLTENIANYRTGVTVVGAKDVMTGMRYLATVTQPKSFTPGLENSLFYIGVERHYTGSADDSLRDYAACLKAAREQMNITPLTPDGLPPWFMEFTVDYDPSVRVGDVPRVCGVKAKVVTIAFGALNAGDGPRMKLNAQLAEDVI